MKLLGAAFCAAAALLAIASAAPSRYTTLNASTLVRRFEPLPLADDQLWDEAVCKGGRLVGLMLGSDAEAGPQITETKNRQPPSASSEWQGNLIQEMSTWKWHNDFVEDVYGDMDESWHVQSVVDALNINGKPKSQGGKMIPYKVVHGDPNDKNVAPGDQKYTVNGKEYRCTAAQHAFTINPTDGVIIGQFLESPATATERTWYRRGTPDELPALRKLSDIFWGYWNRDNPNIANIRYFWMMDIANEDTEQLIARVLNQKGKKSAGGPASRLT
ncbi:hypothetical protein BU23DRAFT_250221 [Bimuria novae-zelandiae CBS 107.79]|uniref:Uncharacterized protein n=1 Tax=Bimuria novae-zelandiae CBS 107.79 TaxID=1447943 RepID=A0A6A5VN83_9PLEO|nr:hypothetical protein BU23DRAFT_250221 [Bimuria novae-zelandiae CBS 107.79]